MNSEIKYELPIFSSNLEKDPVIESKDMIIIGSRSTMSCIWMELVCFNL